MPKQTKQTKQTQERGMKNKWKTFRSYKLSPHYWISNQAQKGNVKYISNDSGSLKEERSKLGSLIFYCNLINGGISFVYQFFPLIPLGENMQPKQKHKQTRLLTHKHNKNKIKKT